MTSFNSFPDLLQLSILLTWRERIKVFQFYKFQTAACYLLRHDFFTSIDKIDNRKPSPTETQTETEVPWEPIYGTVVHALYHSFEVLVNMAEIAEDGMPSSENEVKMSISSFFKQ